MTAADSLYRRVGALDLPALATGASTLADLDPARDVLLDLLAAALNAELGPRWAAAANATPVHAAAVPLLPVASKLPHLPDLGTVRQVKIDFPCLCVYRSGEATLEYATLWERKLSQEWSVDYILGPLTTGDERRMGDALIAALKVIDQTIEAGGHRAYLTSYPGTASAQPTLVLGSSYDAATPGNPEGTVPCYFDSVEVKKATLGAAQFAGDGPKYWALTLSLLCVEQDSDTAEDAGFDGVSLSLGIGSAEGQDTTGIVADTAVPLVVG